MEKPDLTCLEYVMIMIIYTIIYKGIYKEISNLYCFYAVFLLKAEEQPQTSWKQVTIY